MPQEAPESHAGRLRHGHNSYSAAGDYKDI